jgi:hypothetical protein
MRDEAIIREDLRQLCEHKEYIYKLFGVEIRRLTFLSMKYKSEEFYEEVIRTKKTFNIIRHILNDCSEFTGSEDKTPEDP